MAVVRPLAALRPRPELAAEVAAVPYDVVDTEEARALAAGNPHSFLHVTRAEIDLPPGTDAHAPAVYAAGRAALERFVAEGVLVRDGEPALYVYRLTLGEHSQVGVMGCCSVDEYDTDRIKKHEKTRPDKEDDRTRHLLALACHPEPVFLTYRAEAKIDRLVARVLDAEEPLYDFSAPDGVEHTVWRVPAGGLADDLSAAFADKVPALYVADGHHRCAAASRARAARQEGHPEHDGSEPYNVFLAVVFPHDQVRILPYNRVVHDLAGQTPEDFLERLAARWEVTPDAEPEADGRGRFAMYLAGRWYGLAAPRELVEAEDPVESLDAAILQREVLAPLLGVDDPRTSARIDFVGGIRGSEELARRVDRRAAAGTPAVAFALHPVSVEELMAVADAGRVLPPKSTWFEPKLRSGLTVHEF
ncbi:MAG TPA: DUF1015 family protein [Thermoanaerobaculia bacterium]|nr:DUF1015 family protein [Thermoanaerobaculia bacterium]